MSPEQVKLREIFSEALTKVSTEERERYLAAVCGDDADLRRQMDLLLEAHAQSGEFLRDNVIAPNGPPLGEGPGSVIGRYKLLQQIGEGGFGVVFMAEQQEPVRRMVALKIVKAGMDTKEVVARFEAGRQALALMDHPNIARVLDGGATPSGRPFFVMELIKGIPITEFCDQHQLPIEARLRLFMKVCAGVQHAHQKGVIHRDLKPSNVLVTLHDGEPVPKVIDFGIAKALGQKLTERTLFTRFEELLGTPAYMSPEQAEWSGLDIDTRSDLYSLGVLLYELLTGTTPLEKETLAHAALDEMRRMIRETEPPKPSTRLEAGLRGQKSEVGSQKSEGKGQTAPSQPSPLHPQLSDSASLRQRLHLVRGDLDWIVMKALEKDRTRRYETVNGLARDIERHLNGEPVVACPPSKTYRAGKFIRKHRVGVAAMAGVTLALVAGLVLALLGFAHARRERQRAQDEAAKATAISDFLQKDLLMQASPNSTNNSDVTVREVVDRAAARIGDRFTNQPLVEADIRATLGNIYGYQNKFDSAEIQLQRAFELFTKLLGPDHKDTLNALNLLVQTKTLQGKFGEAEPLAHRFVEACRRTQGPDSEATLNSLYVLAMCYSVQGRVGESLPLFQELLERRRRVSGLESNDTIEAMGGLAEDYAMLGRSLDAVQLYEEIVRICRGRSDLQYGLAGNLASLGNSYLRAGDLLEGVGIMKEAVEVDRRVWGPQDPRTLRDMLTLNTGYGATGSWESCIVLCREAVQSTNDLGLWLNLTYRGAVAAVLVGDTNAFRDFAGRLLSQFAGTTNADWARMTAEICLLTPDAVPDMQPVFRLAELGLSDEPAYPLGRPLARGMAEYRRGHLDEALRWFEAPRRAAHGPQPSQASYFCAMIHQRLGDGASARADLDQAAQQLAAYVRFGLSESWDGYGRIATVRAEAERLILGRTVSPPLDAAWLESARKQWEPVRRHLAQVECLVHQRKWAEARDEYVAAMREPVFDWGSADLEFPQKIGISFLLAGDRQNFEQFCREWFSRLEKNPEPGDAYSLVRTCLAGEPDVTTDLGQLALKWSDKVPLAWGAPGVVSWVRAMIAYRSGQYEDTIKHAKVAETSTQLGMRNAARLFHAMALAKSGRQEEGKKELAQAEVQLHGPLTSMTGDAHWEDLGLCQLALDEAHRLFGTSPTK